MQDRELISRLIQGDSKAFKILYIKYGTKIHYVCRAFRLSESDTEEIIQEVFYRLWKYRAQIDPDLSLNAYLQKTARNLVLNQVRKQTNGMKAGEFWASNRFADSLLDQIMHADLEKQAEILVDQLPEQRRKIFIMAKVQHLPIGEIAENLNLSQRTVENQLFRAVKFLREKLKSLQTELQVVGLFIADLLLN